MKTISLLMVFTLGLLLSMVPYPVWALSCSQSYPIIGTVSTITKRNSSYTEILLDNFYTFDLSDFKPKPTYSIDHYEGIAKDYVEKNYQFSQKPGTDYGESFNKVYIPTKAIESIPLKKGDILLQGPPFRTCSYSFSAVFGPDGKLRYAIVDDAFKGYSYAGEHLKVDAGKEIECADGLCTVEVNYNLSGEKFMLIPGQSYAPKSHGIKRITLIRSSHYQRRVNSARQVSEWGSDFYSTYIIDFSEL